MNKPEAQPVLRDLQTLIDVGAVGGLSDGQLLERFVSRREEAVFEVLIRRHGPMVWGVCRRLLFDHHDAEDAFQSTFLVLARRAASVEPRDRVGHWLYGVAFQTARKARAMRAKRQVREHHMPNLPEPNTVQVESLAELLPHLDRELSRLPEKYRAPIVLCDLQEKSHKEAAEHLGWPVGTVSGRLSRARAILAARLNRRGQALSAGSIATLLLQEKTYAAMPSRLIEPTARAGVQVAARQAVSAGLISTEVSYLTGEVLKIMMRSKIKNAAAIVLAGLMLAGGGLVYRARGAGEAQPAPPVEVAESQPSEVSSPPPASPEPQDPTASYPSKIDAADVYEFPSLAVKNRDFQLDTGPATVVPIGTERGITGAVIIGSGRFRYTPAKDKTIEGEFRSAVLRFNPAEQATILPLDKGKKSTDQGAAEMARHLLLVVVRHCWHKGQDLLIPPKGTLAAILYSKEYGDLLLSGDDKTATAFSFTSRKVLYEKK